MTHKTTQTIPNCYLTEPTVCEEYPLFTIRKLRIRRRDGTGPKFIKVGRAVLYRRSAIEDWLESREFESTAEAKMAGIR